MNKIRVLHLITDSRIAGAENLLIEIAENYDKNRFEFIFCTLRKRGRLHIELEKRGAKALSLNTQHWSQYILAIYPLIKIIISERIDIIHTHLIHASLIGMLAGRLFTHRACIVTRHYSDFAYLYKGYFIRLLDRISLSLAHKIIAISGACKKVLVEKDSVQESKITVVYNGIDLGHFDANFLQKNITKSMFGINERTLIIAQIGTFHHRKGHFYSFQAIQQLKKIYPNFRFLVIGEGELKGYLIKLCTSLRIEDKVIFLGYRRDIPQILNTIDILIQPSLEEGFGITLLEAMAARKVVIANNIGGIPEVIDNGVSGFLVAPKDTDSLTAKIEEILSNFDKYKNIRENARNKVEKEFTIQKMVDGYQSIYSDILKQD